MALTVNGGLTVAWVGFANKTTGLTEQSAPDEWLRERLAHECECNGRRLENLYLPLLPASSDKRVEADWFASLEQADRIVVNWSSRIELPSRTIEALHARTAAVPWSVVTSSYLDGSRRTGAGVMSFAQLPWYRWWEAWYGWFFPELARTSAISRAHFAAVAWPIDWAWPQTVAAQGNVPLDRRLNEHRLTIVAGCAQTADAWRSMAEHVGWTVTSVRSINELTACDSRCILVDDTALSYRDVAEGRTSVESEFWSQLISPRDAESTLVVALGLEHMSHWPHMRRLGADDVFVKPSFGLPLCDYLVARFGVLTTPDRIGV